MPSIKKKRVMDFRSLKHIKLKHPESCPKGFNIIQDTTLAQSDSDDSVEEEIVTDDDVDEDECDFYLSESNQTTDTESIDEVPMKSFSISRKEHKFPDELAPETDFVDD